MNWSTISFILCVFGFLKEFRPSEPFITNYLTGHWKNFTEIQVNQDIYPIGTYSYFSTLILVFLVTDVIKYKPAIISCGLSGTVAILTLRFGTTIAHMQIVQLLYGLLLSTEVAYFTYIYAKVNKQHYQQVTSNTRGAFLLGRFTAGIVAQLTTSFKVLDYEQLNYLTVASLATATVWAVFLPPVKQSLYFHRVDLINKDTSASLPTSPDNLSNRSHMPLCDKVKYVYSLLWKDFIKAYTNKNVIKWSLWWAFATCGYLQVINYIQLLWENAAKAQKEVNGEHDLYNGAVEATYTIISTVVVFGIGNLRFNWLLVGEVALSIFSFLEGSLLLICYISYNIWILYAAYIAFGVIYHFIITVASFEIAKHLSEDSYGLIFGINTFLALLLQSLLTFVVVDKNCFGFDVRSQYIVYGGYFIALSIIFIIMGFFTIANNYKHKRPLNIWMKSNESIVSSEN